MSLLAINTAPADLLFVAGSSFGGACIILYTFIVSLNMDSIWRCLVSVRCTSVGLVWVFTTCCTSKTVLCMPLVSNVVALMDGFRYVFLDCAPCCVFVCCFVCASSVSCFFAVPVYFPPVILIILVWFVCMWLCS